MPEDRKRSEGDSLRCAGCGYPLQGLIASHSCPECGTPFTFSIDAHNRNFAHPDWMWWPLTASCLCWRAFYIPLYPVLMVAKLKSIWVSIMSLVLMYIVLMKHYDWVPDYGVAIMALLMVTWVAIIIFLSIIAFWMISAPHFTQTGSIQNAYPWMTFRISFVLAVLTIPIMFIGHRLPIDASIRHVLPVLSGPVSFFGVLAVIMLLEHIRRIDRFLGGRDAMRGKRILMYIFTSIWLGVSVLALLFSPNTVGLLLLYPFLMLLPLALIVVGIGQSYYEIRRKYIQARVSLRRARNAISAEG